MRRPNLALQSANSLNTLAPVDRPEMMQAPALGRLLAYWQSRRQAGRPPRRRDIEPADIVWILPNLMIAEWLPAQDNYRFRLVGTGVVQFYGADFTGKLLQEFGPPQVAAGVRLIYDTVRLGRRPYRTSGTLVERDRDHRSFEYLHCPLEAEDGTCMVLVGGAFG